MLRRKRAREPLFYSVWGGDRVCVVEKWIRVLISLVDTLVYGVARGGYANFDSGAFLPDSSLGI